MIKKSAGLLMYRNHSGGLEVLLVHPGGPYWANKDEGAWSIPKGGIEVGEEPLHAALRECEEETGYRPSAEPMAMEPIRQYGGKLVQAWAVQCDFDPSRLRSNSFEMEWPPRSGVLRQFPEVDRAAWFTLPEARRKMLPSQLPLLAQLEPLVHKKGRDP